MDLATGPSYGAPVVILETFLELLGLIPRLVSRLSARGMLIALVAVMAFVAALAVVMAR
jgi:hypothetical protein